MGGVFVFPQPGMPPGRGLVAGNLLTALLRGLGAGPGSREAPSSAVALAVPNHCFSECGLRIRASPQAACPQLLMR